MPEYSSEDEFGNRHLPSAFDTLRTDDNEAQETVIFLNSKI